MKVQLAQSKQTAIPELNKEEKTLYYLVLGEKENQLVINIGDKTYNKILELLKTNNTEELNKEVLTPVKTGAKK